MNARTVMILGLLLGASAGGCLQVLGADQDYRPAVHDDPSSQGGAPGGATSQAASMSTGPAVPSCAAALTACGADCVNTANDPRHCGACGRDCEGQACAAGVCAPVKLSDGDDGAQFITLRHGFAYYTNHWTNTVRRVSLNGGDSVVIADGQTEACGVVADDTFVYWVVGGRSDAWGAVRKAPLDGGAAITIAADQKYPYDLVVTPSNLLWVNWGYNDNSRTVTRSGLEPGPASALTNVNGDSWAIARGANDAYAMNYWGQLLRIPLDGGAPVHIDTTSQGTKVMTVARDSLYVANWDSGDIQRLSLEGGDPAPFYEGSKEGVTSILGMATDETHIYWTEDEGGVVRKAPLDGGPASLIAIGQSAPNGIGVDDKYVYWVNYYGGAVMRTPK